MARKPGKQRPRPLTPNQRVRMRWLQTLTTDPDFFRFTTSQARDRLRAELAALEARA